MQFFMCPTLSNQQFWDVLGPNRTALSDFQVITALGRQSLWQEAIAMLKVWPPEPMAGGVGLSFRVMIWLWFLWKAKIGPIVCFFFRFIMIDLYSKLGHVGTWDHISSLIGLGPMVFVFLGGNGLKSRSRCWVKSCWSPMPWVSTQRWRHVGGPRFAADFGISSFLETRLWTIHFSRGFLQIAARVQETLQELGFQAAKVRHNSA